VLSPDREASVGDPSREALVERLVIGAEALVRRLELARALCPAAGAVTVVDFARSRGCDVQALPDVLEWVTTDCDGSGDLFPVIEFERLSKRQSRPLRGEAGSA